MEAQTAGQEVVDGVSVNDLSMEHDGGYMVVGMTLDLKGLDVDANRAVLLTPRIANGEDSLELQSVGIYGRRRYYFYVRGGKSMLAGEDEKSFKASKRPDEMAYHAIVPYAGWMNGAALLLRRSDYGCCQTVLAERDGIIGYHAGAFSPELVYVRPKAETVKSHSLEVSAFIDFPVGKTAIDPGYRRNMAELGKIRAIIDSVKGDEDATITSVWLKGYASPEGSYEQNEKLAIGRTEALKEHLRELYSFGDSAIFTSHEAEDWEGLRRHVKQAGLGHRAEILAIIDSGISPDAKEAKIKCVYPEEYRYILRECYPALRHIDYRIAYTIRTFTDVEEIKRVMRERPQKLSLNEFYMAAQECEPGSDEFAEIFETAVRMFPSDETANLNAANAAMQRGDLDGAQRYLDRAGNTPEAAYARGALAILHEDYDAAHRYLDEAKVLGVEQAASTLEELNRRNRK